MNHPLAPAVDQPASPEPIRPRRVPHFAWVVLLLAAFAWFAFAGLPHSEGAVAWGQDLSVARDTASTVDKPVLMFFTADWCPPCRQLKAGPLSQTAIAEQIEEGFVSVKVDLTSGDDQSANQTAARYGVDFIPTLIVTDAQGTELGRTSGGAASELSAWLDRYAAPGPVTSAGR